jgi:hypothetical protein
VHEGAQNIFALHHSAVEKSESWQHEHDQSRRYHHPCSVCGVHDRGIRGKCPARRRRQYREQGKRYKSGATKIPSKKIVHEYILFKNQNMGVREDYGSKESLKSKLYTIGSNNITVRYCVVFG